MESVIRSYAQNLKPSDEEIKKGKEVMDKIFRLFQTSKLVSVDRTKLVGGTQKKTSIKGYIDFDCVIFVNVKEGRQVVKEERQYVKLKEVIEGFKDILLMDEKFDLKDKDVKLSPSEEDPITIMFTVEGIDFDISVAINQADPNRRQNAPIAHEQWRGTYQQQNITNTEEERYRRSVSLVETNIAFAAEKSAFAHEIARLAKFWNKTLVLQLEVQSSYVSGRSSIMELLAFSAAEEEMKFSAPASYLNAFRRFLAKLRDIKQLKLSHQDFWTRYSIPHGKISHKPAPYLLEPSDPTNNLLETMKPEIMAVFSRFAEESLRRLEACQRGAQNVDIFGMQPKWFENRMMTCEPERWLIWSTTTRSSYVDLKYNRNVANTDHREYTEWLQKFLVPIVRREYIRKKQERSLRSSTGRTEVAEVKEGIQQAIGKEILTTPTSWTTCSESHDSRMATFTIPFNDDQNNAIRISFDWKKK